MHTPEPTGCKNCGGSDLKWHCAAINQGGAQDGRIRMSEVGVHFFLGCEDCSETLMTAPAEAILKRRAAVQTRDATVQALRRALEYCTQAIATGGHNRVPGSLCVGAYEEGRAALAKLREG